MEKLALSRASHFSIVWGVTLAVITLVEWHSLDRDPVRQEIFSPFIERRIAVSIEEAPVKQDADLPTLAGQETSPDAALRYNVDIAFNGPAFLACFFVPVLIFHGVGMLWRRRNAHGA